MYLLDEAAATPEKDVVRLVITDEQAAVLLVQEVDDENWKLPGGKIHEGETVFDAAEREVGEELGFQITRDAIFNVVKAHIPDSDNYRYILGLTADSSQVQPTKEVAQTGFFDLGSLPSTKFAEHISSAVRMINPANSRLADKPSCPKSDI